MGERTIKNALFNAVSGMLPLILTLFFWPYIVSELGDTSYGMYALVGAVIGYFALLDLGMGRAVIKFVAEYSGRSDRARLQETIGAALAIFSAVGAVGSLLIFSLARMLATRLLKIPPDLIETAYICFCATSIGFLITTLLTCFTAIINGLNRYDISSISAALMGTATTLGTVILLRMGFGLISLVWLNVLIPLVMVISYALIIRHLLPDVHLRFIYTPASMKRLLHFGVYTLLRRISNAIVLQVTPIIIGATLGVTMVTYYIIPFKILNQLTNLLVRIGVVIFPAISELQGQNRTNTIRDLYLTSSRLILSFSAAFTVPLLIFGERLLHHWMGPAFANQSGIVLALITLGFFFDQCTNVPTFVANGLGRPKISAVAAVSNSALLLCLMIPGGKYAGITGVAAAFCISNAIVSPIYVWYVCSKIMKIRLFHFLREAYMRPLVAAITVAIPLLLVPQARISNLFPLLVVMAAGMGLYFVLALLFGVYQPRERMILGEYLAKTASHFHIRMK